MDQADRERSGTEYVEILQISIPLLNSVPICHPHVKILSDRCSHDPQLHLCQSLPNADSGSVRERKVGF